MSFMFLLLSVWLLEKLKSQTWPGIYIALGQLWSLFKHSSQSSPFEMSELFAVGPKSPRGSPAHSGGTSQSFQWAARPSMILAFEALFLPLLRSLELLGPPAQAPPEGLCKYIHPLSTPSPDGWLVASPSLMQVLAPVFLISNEQRGPSRTHHLHPTDWQSASYHTHSAWTFLSCFDFVSIGSLPYL